MPFDWRTPYGYLVAVCAALPAVYYVIIQSICNVCSAIGPCCFMIAFAKDITAEMMKLDESATMNDHGHPTRFYQKMCSILKFHANAKQLS